MAHPQKGNVLANTIILCVTVILIGYGSYASVIIRSSVNPPMNSNGPTNPYGLLGLLNRDQYGARPLVKGNYYSSPAIAVTEKIPTTSATTAKNTKRVDRIGI